MKLLIFFIPLVAMAGFTDLSEGESYKYEDSKKTRKDTVRLRRSAPKRNSELNKLANELLKKDELIEKILRGQEKTLIVRKKSNKIKALTRLRGTVLNSILAMNVRPTTFIVKLVTDEIDLMGGELRCQGVSFEKRVLSSCDLLVTEMGEFQVDVKIWDMDGAEGIIADYYYSGEEKAFLTSSFASFFEGVIDGAKDRILTPFGDSTRNNSKNKVLGGLTGVASNIKEQINNSSQKNLEVAFVDAEKEVLVFFNQTLTMKEDRR